MKVARDREALRIALDLILQIFSNSWFIKKKNMVKDSTWKVRSFVSNK